MYLANYLGYLHGTEAHLAEAFRQVGEGHAADVDIYYASQTLARQCDEHAEKLAPFLERYGEERPTEPDRLYHELFGGTRSGGLGLLRDLHDLYVVVSACDIAWTMVGQAAQGARDADLLRTVESCEKETVGQLRWLRTRMKQAAPQALLVSS